MIPAFEIYFLILSDAWMPWLKENRDDCRFEPVILSNGIRLRETTPEFFKGIYSVFKKHLNVCPVKILAELEQLAAVDRSPAGRKLTEAFLQLPAHTSKEVFYNVITGHSLAGYYDLCSRLLNNSGLSLPEYYFTKILDRLQHLLSLPGPAFPVTEPELVSAVNVKVAVLALFYKLTEKYDEFVEGTHGFFSPEVWLEGYLQQINLSQKGKDQAMQLFQSLTERTLSVELPKPVKNEHSLGKQKDELPSDYKLSPILRELEQEFSGMKAAVERAAEEKKSGYQGYIGSREVMELLNISKTTLKRYRDKGKIKYKNIGGKMLYSRNDFNNPPERSKKQL